MKRLFLLVFLGNSQVGRNNLGFIKVMSPNPDQLIYF